MTVTKGPHSKIFDTLLKLSLTSQWQLLKVSIPRFSTWSDQSMTIFYFAFKTVIDQSMTVNRGLHPNIFDKAFKMHTQLQKVPFPTFMTWSWNCHWFQFSTTLLVFSLVDHNLAIRTPYPLCHTYSESFWCAPQDWIPPYVLFCKSTFRFF